MGKNKNKFHHQPTPPPAPPQPEPTTEQLAQIETAANEVDALSATHGPVPTENVSEQASATVAETLKRLEGFLVNARSLFEKARTQEVAAAAETERLSQRRKTVEQDELELLGRLEQIEKRQANADAKDAELTERGARLAAREQNEREGFLAEKAAILRPVEDTVKRLQDERTRLDAEIASRRQEEEAEFRGRAAARAAKWAEDDEHRSITEAEARRQSDERVARERNEKLEALRLTLAAERRKEEEAWQTERDRRTKLLEEKEAQLEKQGQDLANKVRAQRASEADLQAAKEIYEDNRAALGRKIDRLVSEQSEKLQHELAGLRKQLDEARSDRERYWNDLESRKALDRRFGERSPQEILSALTCAEKERDALAQKVRQLPDAGAAKQLSELQRERSAWLEERARLQGDLARSQGELATRRLAAIQLETLKKEKEALEVHKQLLDGAVNELSARVDELTRQDDHRNPMTALTSLDEKEELQAETRTTTPFGKATPSLKEFAIDLRHRIANGVEGRTLYYADRDVRAFLGGLAMGRLMLLQGISGTGKTSLPRAFASAVDGGIEIVEVQAGWRDRQDLVGYYNAFHRHYYATNFLQALYKAGTPAYRDRLFLMVLDEINLSRPEQFFADFLSALEHPIGERRLTLVNDPITNAPRLMKEGRHLPIPPNVWFVGTANHDESTAEFADKTYDRAHVMEMPRKTQAAQFKVEERGPRNPISYGLMQTAFANAAKAQTSAVAKATIWLQTAPFAADLQQRFRVGWGNRLEDQLARYLPVVVESGGTIGEAMDHLLVTKVMRKLKDRHDVRATALEDLRAKLYAVWDKLDGNSVPERCGALLDAEILAKKGEELA